MTNKTFANRMLTALVVVASVVFPYAGVALADDGSDSGYDAEQLGYSEIAELRSRAEAAVIEVNEASRAAREKTEAIKRERYREELGYVPSGQLLDKEEIKELEEQRAAKEKAIRSRIEWEIKSLEERKARAAERQASEADRAAEARPRVVTPGTVTGIAFCEDKGAALILGEIVRENDEIYGVKVIRVTPTYVEFEKQGKKWIQRVGQTPPAAAWDQKAPPSAGRRTGARRR